MPEHEKTSITLSVAKMLKISRFQGNHRRDQLFESSTGVCSDQSAAPTGRVAVAGWVGFTLPRDRRGRMGRVHAPA